MHICESKNTDNKTCDALKMFKCSRELINKFVFVIQLKFYLFGKTTLMEIKDVLFMGDLL